ncbi:MAG: hypothetical protein NVSMB24_09270 [Mucilaginibacter sp.]
MNTISTLKKITVLQLFLSINIVVLVTGCADAFLYSDDRLKIINKSKMDISVLYSNGTDETENSTDYYTRNDNIIKPDSTYILRKRGKKDEWSKYITEGPGKKISIYIFAVDTLRGYRNIESMNELCYHHKYLKKFIYSESQLAHNNWKIVFIK